MELEPGFWMSLEKMQPSSSYADHERPRTSVSSDSGPRSNQPSSVGLAGFVTDMAKDVAVTLSVEISRMRDVLADLEA